MKFSLNTALTIVAIIMAAAIGYFSLVQKPAPLPPSDMSIATIANQPTGSITYTNSEYGFNLALPARWKGYSVINDQWLGDTTGPNGDVPSEKGPLIMVRHPQWTEAAPRQDIPVMVFTTTQWKALAKDQFHIGAAPIGPMELDQNAKYVFALPARYNYAFITGYEEVAKILAGKPLKAF